MTKHPALIVFGPQGSGKSTQAERLSQKLHFEHFDMGAFLRQAAKHDQVINNYLQAGTIVPTPIISRIVHEYLQSLKTISGIVFDGFPRNLEQCEILDELAYTYNLVITGIYIHLTDETAKSRLAKRTIVVDGVEQVRQDDKPELVAKRLENFKRETLPIVKYLREHHEVLEVDGEPDIPTVTAKIDQVIAGVLDG